jgi:hypothetical protein
MVILPVLVAASATAAVPSSRAIAEIESGTQLSEVIQSVGVADSASMNRASRVRVRAVSCTTPVSGAALCVYEADHCRDGETDGNNDGWCRRETRFVRDEQAWQGEPQSGGWIRERISTETPSANVR